MSLKYWRQHVSQKEMAFEFGVGETIAHGWIVSLTLPYPCVKMRPIINDGGVALP